MSQPAGGGATGAGRRSNYRSKVMGEVVGLTSGARGSIIDLSQDGVGVQITTEAQFTSGERVHLFVPDLVTPIEAECEIAWTRSGRAGLRFVYFPRNSGEQFLAWFTQHQEEAAATEYPTALAEIIALERQLDLSSMSLEQALNDVVQRMRVLLEATGAAIALKKHGDFICRASSGMAPTIGVRLQPKSGLTGRCISTGSVIHCEDTESDTRVDPITCRQLKLRSTLIVPVFWEDSVHGVLEVFSDKPYAFRDGSVRVMTRFADLVSQMAWAQKTGSTAEEAAAVICNGCGHANPETAPVCVNCKAPLWGATESSARLTELAKPVSAKAEATVEATPSKQPHTPTSRTSPTTELEITPLAEEINVAHSPTRAEEATVAPEQRTAAKPPEPEPPRRKSATFHPKVPSTLAPAQIEQPAVTPGLPRYVLFAAAIVFVIAGPLAYWFWSSQPSWTNELPKKVAPPARASVTPAAHSTAQEVTLQQTAATGPSVQMEAPPIKAAAPETAQSKTQVEHKDPEPEPMLLANSPQDGLTSRKREEAVAAPSLTEIAPVADGDLTGVLATGVVSRPVLSSSQEIRTSQGVRAGRLIHRVSPVYPSAAKTAGVQGSVRLALTIMKNGRVKDVRVVSGNEILAQAAINAVRQWRYSPYTLNGEPVEVDGVVEINFSLAR